MVVDDVEPVLERMKWKHKKPAIVKRPSARPFAAYSGPRSRRQCLRSRAEERGHAQGSLCRDRRRGWAQDRYVNKFAIRTPNAEECAEFYRDVFELEPVNRKSGTAG